MTRIRRPGPIQGFSRALQADMETGTSTSKIVTPEMLNFHKATCKAWCYVTVSGSTHTKATDHNVTSITDNGVGDITVNLTTAFSSADYVAICKSHQRTDTPNHLEGTGVMTKAVGTCRINIAGTSTPMALTDPDEWSFAAWGDQ